MGYSDSQIMRFAFAFCRWIVKVPWSFWLQMNVLNKRIRFFSRMDGVRIRGEIRTWNLGDAKWFLFIIFRLRNEWNIEFLLIRLTQISCSPKSILFFDCPVGCGCVHSHHVQIIITLLFVKSHDLNKNHFVFFTFCGSVAQSTSISNVKRVRDDFVIYLLFVPLDRIETIQFTDLMCVWIWRRTFYRTTVYNKTN